MTPEQPSHTVHQPFLQHWLPRTLVIFLAFILLNILAAHIMSDCGLPALLNTDACSDDIVRAGWAMQFFEEGGLAFHSQFSTTALLADIAGGVLASILIALGSLRLRRRG